MGPLCFNCLQGFEFTETAKELTQLREENQRLLVALEEKSRQLRRECRINDGLHSQLRNCNKAKIEVLHGILANAADWHLKNYGFPLRGETGHEAVSVELHETLKQLEDKK